MKLATWKRALLAGLLTLSVAGGSLAPVVAGHAAAGCVPCPGGGIACKPAGVRPNCHEE
jgi:hypothetical protein